MSTSYQFIIRNPDLSSLGHVVAVANLNDKHDRSAPSDHHWKILKCRMMVFSNSSILACPDKNEIKRVHIIFNKIGDDFDKVNSMFLKYSLLQEGEIQNVSPEVFEMCFRYTMIAKIAPVWNALGNTYLINNRDFLTTNGPQDGIQFSLSSNDLETNLNLKPQKIHIVRPKESFQPGEWIRVLPSLNKAVVEEKSTTLPETARFKSYKDLRRHWKNIHGYRLPEEESEYYLIRFWRGEPLTYPELCVIRNFPIITPIPRHNEVSILSRFLSCLKSKMPQILCYPLEIQQKFGNHQKTYQNINDNDKFSETQTISLCTPTQASKD